MSALYFFLWSTLIICGLVTVNAQNCAIPNKIRFLDTDGNARVETAPLGTVLGTIVATNVLEIIPKNPDDFLGFSFNKTTSEISIILKCLLKNELDDKRKSEIGSIATLTCADGNTKDVTFLVAMKDQNTKCPQFMYSQYNYTIDLDEIGFNINQTDLFEINPDPIIIRDGDRDFTNADITVTFESQFKNFQISTHVQAHELKNVEADHTFMVTLSLKKGIPYDQRGVHRILLKVHNNEPIADPFLQCTGDWSKAEVFIHFKSNNGSDPPPESGPHVGGPPEFDSFYYYAVITDISQAVKGSFLNEIIQPSEIYASDPDGMHTVIYKIFDNETKGILDIDAYNGSLSFNADLTEDYVHNLKDYMEIYRVEAYISETWLKPNMKVSHIPLVMIYDINHSENDTECITPQPTTTPSIPTEAPTTQTPPFTTTTTSTSIPTTTTTTITDIPVTTTTTSTDIPTTTTSASTDSPIITTTQGPIITTTDAATTEEQDDRTTESNDLTTEAENSISTLTPTSQETTSPETTTTKMPTTTPERPDPELPGCPICTSKENTFRCLTVGLFPDPYLCNVFYQCIRVNSTLMAFKQKCPPYHGFNTTSKSCQYPATCQCAQTQALNFDLYSGKHAFQLREKAVNEYNTLGYGDGEIIPPPPQPNCTECSCGVCSQVIPGESVCDGTSMLYPDPHNCNFFHSCRPDDNGGYIDCLMQCPDDLVFCPIQKVCNWKHLVDCPRGKLSTSVSFKSHTR